MANLQRKCFTEFEDLRDFSLEAIGTLSSRKVLEKRLSVCSHNDIFKLCVRLAMVDETSEISDYSKDSLLEMLVQRHELHENQLEKLNNQPLYPNEMELWDDSLISTEYYSSFKKVWSDHLNLVIFGVKFFGKKNRFFKITFPARPSGSFQFYLSSIFWPKISLQKPQK